MTQHIHGLDDRWRRTVPTGGSAAHRPAGRHAPPAALAGRHRFARRPNLTRDAGAGAELLVCVAAVVGYFGARLVVEGARSTALADARAVLGLEQHLHVDVEHAAQSFALGHRWLVDLGDFSYVWLHWPVVVAALVIVYHRDRARYLQLRNALIASAVVGIVAFAAFPEAPPRDLNGFSGTVSDTARRLYLGTPMSWSNPYASFPSYHVGWTLVACLAVALTVRWRWLRALVLLPAVLVTVAVIVTGNHFVVDAVGGAGLALACFAAAGRLAPSPIGGADRARRTGSCHAERDETGGR